jgi:hypothetical protein
VILEARCRNPGNLCNLVTCHIVALQFIVYVPCLFHEVDECVLMNAPAEAQLYAFQILPIEYILYNVFEPFNTQHAISPGLSGGAFMVPSRRPTVVLISSYLPKNWQPYCLKD